MITNPTTATFTELLDAYVPVAARWDAWMKDKGEIPDDEELEAMREAEAELNRRFPPSKATT